MELFSSPFMSATINLLPAVNATVNDVIMVQHFIKEVFPILNFSSKITHSVGYILFRSTSNKELVT